MTATELEADNAKLRLQVESAHMSRLLTENENAKLLELVEDMLDCIQIRAAFSRPPTDEMCEMFYKRARELGVEVDECW